MIRRTLLSALLAAFAVASMAQNSATINFGNETKTGIKKGASSLNLCWLLDSDLKRPNKKQSIESAFEEVGVGSLRFPYGHLANNYFWHTPPYDNVEGGLRPAVVTMSAAPGIWDWAVNEDASFKSAMDFDEYMALCKRQGIAPLVVVNSLSHKVDDNVTLEMLAECAAEWVRYANKMGYEVAYWQIGNEMDHHPKVISLEEYVEAYTAIVTAMKAVDPNAYIGPGILGKAHYFTKLYEAVPHLVDFTSCHQYMWAHKTNCKDYGAWSKDNSEYIKNVKQMQAAVKRSASPDMEIIITETGVSPSGQGMGDVNNTYKALWWFEVLMKELSVPNVTYSYYWGSHSPWKGEVDVNKDDVAVMFRLDDNSRKPTGEVSKFVNENLGSAFVEATTDAEGLRIFAMSDGNGGGVIMVMNKLTTATPLKLELQGVAKGLKELSATTLYGEKPWARKMNHSKTTKVKVKKDAASVEIAPLSITAFRF